MAYPGQQPPVQPHMYTPTSLTYGASEGSAPPYAPQASMPPYPGGHMPPSYSPAPTNYPMPQPVVPGYPQPAPGYPMPPPGGVYGPPAAPPIVQQPTAGGGLNWMHQPQRPNNCPPGLEYLTMVDQLLVHQKVELLEAFTGFETCNKFVVKNSLGQQVYYAVEDSGCLTRNCCGPLRPFDIKVLDNYRNEVIHINRPLACDSCCFPCCLQSMEITAPPGTVVGTVEQNWSICCPSFTIKNEYGASVLKIEGPFCTFSICGDVDFKVMSADGETQVGKISKQWSGLVRETFTDADHFGITFPMDLDVKMKATLLGACFLIDAMFFEKSGNEERDRPGML